MDSLLQDLRFALRSLNRRRAFTIVAVLTLGLGVGATTAIFSVVNGVLLRALPYEEAERLVAVWEESRETPRDDPGGVMSHPNMKDVRGQSRTLESLALVTNSNLVLTGLGEAEVVPGATVTLGFFEVFRATPVLGRSFAPEEDLPNGPGVVVVGHGFWQERLGGRADVIGSTLEINGTHRTIVGVAPAGFAFPAQARLWVPARNDDESCGRGCVYMAGFGRLAPGASLASARDELRAIAATLEEQYPGSNTDATLDVTSLSDLVVGDVRQALLLIFLAVGMVLLIACANVANLLLVRGAGRTEEVAVRAALGADRGRVVRQLLTESLVLGGLGGLLGIGLASLGVDVLKVLSPGNIPRLDEVSLDGVAVAFAVGLVAATSLLFGLAPALKLARTSLSSALREGGRGGTDGRGAWGRSALLVTEVALSLMLLLGAGLLLRSFATMQSVDPGFESRELVHFSVSLPQSRYETPEDVVRANDRLRAELAALPGVRSVVAVTGLPLGPTSLFGSFRALDRPSPEEGREPAARVDYVSAGYFEAMGIPLLQGRTIEEGDRRESLPVIVVSRSAAERYWPGESALGKQLELQIYMNYPEDRPRTVVGVVDDVRSAELTREPEPEFYVPYAQAAPRFTAFVARASGDPAAFLASARSVVQGVDSKLPLVRPGTMDELVDQQLARPRFYFLLIGLFALLAVVLAAVGIYGVVAYVVSRRTREIGVRMALGATPELVVRLVVAQGLRPALLGAGLGLAGVLAGSRLISGLLYGVRPQDPLALSAATLLLFGVVLLACLLPARRATRIPPASALRAE